MAQDLLKTFELELGRSAEQIQSLLLSVERAAPAEAAKALREAYRLTHSVKGAARIVGLSSIEEMAHALEERLQALVRADARPTAEMTSAFLRVVDGFTAGLTAFQKGEELDPEPFMQKFRALSGVALERQVPGSAGLVDDAAVAEPSPPPGPGGPAPAIDAPAPRDAQLRVPTQAVDELLRRVEESFLIETRLVALAGHLDERAPDRLRGEVSELHRETAKLHQVLVHLHEVVRSFRLEPFERLRVGLTRMVRELAVSLGKSATLRFSGRHELVDAATLDALQEPLLHLVRNAVDHGVETPEARRAANKPEEATVEVSGVVRGGALEVRVSDDGRGVELEAVRASAVRRGLVEPSAAASLGEPALLELLFESGFSTAGEVTAISGRGLGLDIVRSRLSAMGGEVRLSSRPGLGATFELSVPVKRLSARALLVRSGPHTAALPVASIERVVAFREAEVAVSAGAAHVTFEGTALPVEPLADHLGWERGHASHVVVVGREGARRGLLVDELLGEVEQPAMLAPACLAEVPFLGGVLVLGTGEVVPLIEPRELGRPGGASRREARPRSAPQPTAPSAGKHRVLVVDDSPTVRALHGSVLEEAGFAVTEAEDGVQALERLAQGGVELVVLDIQMPRMDGLTLVSRVRESAAFRHLPLIVVSQYGRKEDLHKAAALGADRYIVKATFEPGRFVEMVRELLEEAAVR